MHRSRFTSICASETVKKLKQVHQVAFEADEMDPHGDGAVGVVAESVNPVDQVRGKLVTSLQDAQHHDVTVTQVVHDVACQTFRPVSETQRKHPLTRSRKGKGTFTQEAAGKGRSQLRCCARLSSCRLTCTIIRVE